MAKLMLLIVAGSLIIALPSFVRISCGDFRSLFWSDVFFDVLIIAIAIWSKNLTVVVVSQVSVNMLNGWIYQKRADDIYSNLPQQPKKRVPFFSLLQTARA